MIQTLHRLLAHLRWADQRALEALREAPPNEAALTIYAHILAAEHIWLARLRGEEPEMEVWPKLTLEECEWISRSSAGGYESYLGRLIDDDARRELIYRNSAGQTFRSTVEDILLHVVMHGSYHRGQIALLLRQSGSVPPVVDYIAFVRGAPAAPRGE